MVSDQGFNDQIRTGVALIQLAPCQGVNDRFENLKPTFTLYFEMSSIICFISQRLKIDLEFPVISQYNTSLAVLCFSQTLPDFTFH